MKNNLAILLISLASCCYATGQRGELIIYMGDTLEMLCEPLEIYLRANEPREKHHPFLKDGCSTALWRGYVGLWEIKNDRLVLVDVFGCGDKTISIKDNIFKGQNSEIFAEWFNGELYIEKGKLIKYYHSAYDRYYEHEIVVTIADGIVKNKIEYQNGVKPEDKGFSRNPEDIQSEIYRRIDWDRLPKLSNDKKLFVTIKVNESGKLNWTDIRGQLEGEYKRQIEQVINDFPIVKVFYSRGVPINEGWTIPLFFSNKSKRKYGH